MLWSLRRLSNLPLRSLRSLLRSLLLLKLLRLWWILLLLQRKVKEYNVIPRVLSIELLVKTIAEDERYSKYFKMLKMGVPLQVNHIEGQGVF